jgi:hypothetical protein
MKTPARVVLFGLLSGLLWSVVPGILANLFESRANVPATLIAGVATGILTSLALASVLGRFGPILAVVLGLFSLPLGAFIFGFAFEIIAHFFPTLSSGDRTYLQPWRLGLNYALLSVISIFAIGLFPLAVFTTLFLRRVMLGGKKRAIAG